MSTGMNRRRSRTYASRLDDEWQLDTNWTAKPTWKVEQIFFAFLSFIDTCHDISVFALLQGGSLFLFQVLFDWWNWVCCCCQAKSHVFAMIKILAMTIRSILLRDYFYPGKNTRNELEELGNDNCLLWSSVSRFHIVWKSLKMSHLNFTTLAFYTIICSFWPVW